MLRLNGGWSRPSVVRAARSTKSFSGSARSDARPDHSRGTGSARGAEAVVATAPRQGSRPLRSGVRRRRRTHRLFADVIPRIHGEAWSEHQALLDAKDSLSSVLRNSRGAE